MALSEDKPGSTLTEADERRSARGGAVSMFVDSFDVYLPAFVLPAAMGYFLPPGLPVEIRATFTTLLFTIGLLARPIGSVIFGNLSDRIGRKRVTMISGWGFTVVTLIMGLLPGYMLWGYGAITLFAVLRLIGGIFLAGGYAAPIPLALEQAKESRRGRVGGLIGMGAPASVLMVNLLLFILLEAFPHDGFLNWGWRIPFLVGFGLGVVYLMHYRKVVEDESVYVERRAAGRKQPVVELFTTHRTLILSVFLFTCGYWFTAQMSVSFLPTLLVQVLGVSPQLTTTVEMVSSIVTIAMILALASWGQRIGRRKLLMGWALVITVAVCGSFLLLGMLVPLGAPAWLIVVLGVIAKAVPSAPLGVILVYLNERFPASVRASGYGIGYMFGLILPGLYTFWLLALSAIMPYEFGPIVLVLLGGVLMFAAVRKGPETNPPADRAVERVPAAGGAA
ncbi:MFS transporter [Saccharopolyspora sp. K220]|uniref:MFS transporter n=1 Tax=Saccharopolyspora soli TaxID=2926618 RepID=UPI001F59F558|nr:MFS transporter [Saccharopolyspora soli]MCI2423211.1 MFS transporter [Saccharopolyspora soli]